MADAARMLLEEALSLPTEDRELRVSELQASLGVEEADDEWNEAWAEECAQRIANLDVGVTRAVSLAEAEARLLSRPRS